MKKPLAISILIAVSILIPSVGLIFGGEARAQNLPQEVTDQRYRDSEAKKDRNYMDNLRARLNENRAAPVDRDANLRARAARTGVSHRSHLPAIPCEVRPAKSLFGYQLQETAYVIYGWSSMTEEAVPLERERFEESATYDSVSKQWYADGNPIAQNKIGQRPHKDAIRRLAELKRIGVCER